MTIHAGARALIVLFALIANTLYADEKLWLDGTVVAVGHVASDSGTSVPSATIVLRDPGNSDPASREQIWVVTAGAYLAKTMVELKEGALFKAYRTGETSRIYGYVVVKYADKKGRDKGDFHLILKALGKEDIPH